VYQKLFIDVFGDPDVNKDGTLNYSKNKDEKALCYKKILARAIDSEIYDENFMSSSVMGTREKVRIPTVSSGCSVVLQIT
jgi:hypothetical protein